MSGFTQHLAALRSWVAADWRRSAAALIVVIVAIGSGLVAAAAIGSSRGDLGAEMTPPASPSETAEPTPSETPPATVEPSSSAAPVPESATPTPSPAPAAGAWEPVAIPGLRYVTDMAERDARLVALGSDSIETPGTAVAYSDDGAAWTAADLSGLGLGGAQLHELAVGDPGFVAFGFPTPTGRDPNGIYLFSADGITWERGTPPDQCVGAGGVRWVRDRFLAFGGPCGQHGGAPPGPAVVLTSRDGRAWEARVDDTIHGGPWASDGERIVLLPGCCTTETALAISDDGGQSWRTVTDPALADVTIYSLAWGHGRWVAEASWLIRPGDPDHAVCVSTTGETWTCDILGPLTVPTPELRAVGAVTPTDTGFVSLKFAFDDQFAPSGTTIILGISTDGRAWSFAPLPAMADTVPMGSLASATHGFFAYGLYRPEAAADGAPLLLVHRAPLP